MAEVQKDVGLQHAIAIKPLSLDEQLSRFSDELLNSQCIDIHLVKLTHSFSEWQVDIAVGLELTDVDIQTIEMAWPRRLERQKMEMFRKWKEVMSNQATYQKLIEVFHRARRADVIDDLHKIVNTTPLRDGCRYRNLLAIVEYGGYVKDRYVAEIWKISSDWPPVQVEKIFNLAMIEDRVVDSYRVDNDYVQMTTTGKIDDILGNKRSIKLQDIFQISGSKRKVILLKGAPGSGKTTLTLHICQKWGEGKLFQEFAVVITVQLRDPGVQNAQTLADLLPSRDTAMAEEIAAEITAKDGEGVLWILDGWDELPTDLQAKSIFRDIISPPAVSSVSKSAVLVTSRPISANTSDYCKTIEILGFTTEELKLYLVECLKEPSVSEELLKKIHENPMLESSCYLPLNAAILAHLYRWGHYSLPSTQYEIFLNIILNIIYRHIQKEGNHKNLKSLNSFRDLPDDLSYHFQAICRLAYDGMMNNKVAFQSTDLPENFNMLGLFQTVETFCLVGRSTFYHFHHLTFQELLATYYITNNLTSENQMLKFKELVKLPRYNTMLQFYAAITKSEKDGFRKFVSDNYEKINTLLLLRCIQEIQDQHLCHFVASRLELSLELRQVYLDAADCLAIGYFLSHALDFIGILEVDLTLCHIGNHGCKFLLKYITSSTTGHLRLCLPGYQLGIEGLQNLTQFVEESKALHSLIIGQKQSSHIVYIESISTEVVTINLLHALSVSLTKNNSLTELSLIRSNLEVTETNGPALTEMLQVNKSLQVLNLEGNPKFGDLGASYIAEGLKQNNSLKSLCISNCGLTTEGAETVAQLLTENKTIQILRIDQNYILDAGVVSLANALISNSSLQELNLANCHMTDTSLKVLGECLIKNNSLKVLQIGYDDHVQASLALSTNEQSRNIPTEQGMLLLGCHLSDCQVFECLKLSENLMYPGILELDGIIVIKTYTKNKGQITVQFYKVNEKTHPMSITRGTSVCYSGYY